MTGPLWAASSARHWWRSALLCQCIVALLISLVACDDDPGPGDGAADGDGDVDGDGDTDVDGDADSDSALDADRWDADSGGNPLLSPANWTTYNIADGANVGAKNAVALVGGLPAVVYTRDDFGYILFARATAAVPADASAWQTMTIDEGGGGTGGTGGLGGSLHVDECIDVPCVTYEAPNDLDVYFACASSAEPTQATDWSVHEPDGQALSHSSLHCGGGAPMLAYSASSGVASLRFARTAVWGIPQSNTDWTTMDVETEAGFYVSAQVATVADAPAIVYQHQAGGTNRLRYAFAASSEPSQGADWTVTTVDESQTNSGEDPVLIEAGGLPSLAYRNVEISDFLRYATTDTAAPTGPESWTLTTVSQLSRTHVGQWLDMTWYLGGPLMSYVNTGSDSIDGLHLTVATEADPTSEEDFETAIIDPAESYSINEQTHVLLLADGTPAVLYRTNQGLRFGFYTPPS